MVTAAPRGPASSIRANIEALLPQISALTGSTCRTTSERESGIAFLIHALHTFERGTTKTQEQYEDEYLENVNRQIAANRAVPPTSVKFLRNYKHRENSKSEASFIAIVATFNQEPTFAIPGHIPGKKTTWHIYNWSCKAEHMHPNHKNSVCKNCLEFGHPTDICMASNQRPKCRYCGVTHNHFNYECTATGCNEKAPCRHTVLYCNMCGIRKKSQKMNIGN